MQNLNTREQIVSTAARLIWERGYQRTSVDEIIREAGVCKGSFYHYFTSKESLGAAVIDCWTGQFADHISSQLSSDRCPEDNIHAVLDAFVEAQEQTGYLGCPLGRMALEMGDVSESLQERLQDGFDTMKGFFVRYLQAAGMAEDQASEQGRYMLATLEGALLLDKVRGGGQVLHGLVATMKSDVSVRLVEVA